MRNGAVRRGYTGHADAELARDRRSQNLKMRVRASGVVFLCGLVRIFSSHDLRLGGALIACSILLAVQTWLYYRKLRSLKT